MALFDAGVDSLAVRVFGRWKSDAVVRYTRIQGLLTSSTAQQTLSYHNFSETMGFLHATSKHGSRGSAKITYLVPLVVHHQDYSENGNFRHLWRKITFPEETVETNCLRQRRKVSFKSACSPTSINAFMATPMAAEVLPYTHLVPSVVRPQDNLGKAVGR